MLKEFKEFAMRGNVLDMAIGIILGAAFGKIVSSVVDDLLMPVLGLFTGKIDFSSLFVDLSGGGHASLAAAKQAGAATLNYGMFLNTVVNFLLVAFAIFVLVKQINRIKREQPAPAPAPSQRECPHCLMTVPIRASRCGHCTSALQPA